MNPFLPLYAIVVLCLLGGIVAAASPSPQCPSEGPAASQPQVTPSEVK